MSIMKIYRNAKRLILRVMSELVKAFLFLCRPEDSSPGAVHTGYGPSMGGSARVWSAFKMLFWICAAVLLGVGLGRLT